MNLVTGSFMSNLRVRRGAHDATECPACAKTVPRRTTGMPGPSVFCSASVGAIVDELFVMQGLVAAGDACQALGTLDAEVLATPTTGLGVPHVGVLESVQSQGPFGRRLRLRQARKPGRARGRGRRRAAVRRRRNAQPARDRIDRKS